jgi:putative flippase GtrA
MARLIRYLGVGALNTLLCLALIMGLRQGLGWPDAWASLLGYGVGVLLSFVVNRRWTFRCTGRGLDRLPRFVVVLAAAWLCNLAVVLTLLQAGWPPAWAHASGAPVYTLVSYLGCAWFVFRRAQAPRAAGS